MYTNRDWIFNFIFHVKKVMNTLEYAYLSYLIYLIIYTYISIINFSCRNNKFKKEEW